MKRAPKQPVEAALETEAIDALKKRVATLEDQLNAAAAHIRFMRNTMTKLTGISTQLLGE